MRLVTLDQETTRSEILRALILLGLFLLLGFYMIYWNTVYPNEYNLAFAKHVRHWLPPSVLFVFASYYALLYYQLKRLELQKKSIPSWGRYASTLFETSIPTLFMLLLAIVHSPADVVLSSRIFFYFMFII